MTKKRSISLVLGSGGARGIAHIGVIRWLEEHNFAIESVSGCSMGALIGAVYASGRLDAFALWLEELDVLDMLSLLDFKGNGGLVSGERLMKKLDKFLSKEPIEKLPLRFTAVATDIDAQKELWFNSGSLREAVRASISLPLFFSPYHYKGKRLVDGGVLNPVPIAPTFGDHTDLTISVNLGGEALTQEKLENESENKNRLQQILKEYFGKIALTQNISLYSVANKSFDTMQSSMARMKLAAYPSDIEIDLPINLCGTFEFHRAKELIAYGYNHCQQMAELKEIDGKSV